MAKPTLIVIAGCNGSGKSSFSNAIVPKGVIPYDYDKHFLKTYDHLIDSDFREIMAHNIVKGEFEDMIQSFIEKEKDFCYETNFNSTPLFWPEKFSEAGYELDMIFFCLDSIQEAKKRVQIRVENGGHFVPENEIINRFYLGYQNLNQYFGCFNKVHLLNSSFYNKEPRHILSIENGQISAISHIPKFLPEMIPNIIELT